MRQKYFSCFACATVILLSGAILTGCGNQPADETANTPNNQPLSVETNTPAEQPAAQVATSAPVMTDAQLDQEVNNLDADLNSIKTTGFEATNLSDKDLGL